MDDARYIVRLSVISTGAQTTAKVAESMARVLTGFAIDGSDCYLNMEIIRDEEVLIDDERPDDRR